MRSCGGLETEGVTQIYLNKIDGRLLCTRVINPEGSEWVTTEIYSADGRLFKSISGASGEPGTETLLTYDEAGRLLAMTSSGGNSGRIDFHYDEQGRKTKIQSFDPKVLQ